MSLKIYVDDCANAHPLVTLLRRAGHQVTTPAEAGVTARADAVHWQYARDHRQVILTKNPGDFKALHEQTPEHDGVFAIYQDNDPERDMSYPEIVRSIANIENAGVPIRGTFHILNAWRY